MDVHNNVAPHDPAIRTPSRPRSGSHPGLRRTISRQGTWTLADVRARRGIRVLRVENEAEDLLHYLKRSGHEPGLKGPRRHATANRCSSGGRRPSLRGHTQRRRDRRRLSLTLAAGTALPEQLVLDQRYGR